MDTSSAYSSPVRLTAFVGRSFHYGDKDVWREIEEMLAALRPMGFLFEDAKEAQPRSISQKVRDGIDRNQIYVAILTRREPLANAQPQSRLSAAMYGLLGKRRSAETWTTSAWVIQEIGYAIGRGRRVLTLVEDGVQYPVSDLDGDTEWIRFSRDDVTRCQTALTQMISRLLSRGYTTAHPCTLTRRGTTRGGKRR